MQIAGMVFKRPTILKTLSFFVEVPIVVLMLYALRLQIEEGKITNEPELLRSLMFYGFSLAICFRFCYLIGLGANTWPMRFLMFAMFYVPIGLGLAKLSGVI
jgi:hypothetical protein